MPFSPNPFLLKKAFRNTVCEILYQDVVTRRSNLYYFLGKTLASDIDDIPLDILDTQTEEFEIRKAILGMKKINSGDISFVTRRYDWVSGEIFDMYDSTVELNDKSFYVLTDEFNVYKCLDNNSGGLSTVKPIGIDIEPKQYVDGYIWKYMYTVPLILRNKFMNEKYMPVTRALSKHFYSNGAILDVIVTNPGSGYRNDPRVSLTVVGAGTNAIVDPVIDPIDGKIVSVFVRNGGFNYTENTTIAISDVSSSPGSGAVLEPIVENGVVVRVLVRAPGYGYSSDIRTTISAQGDGTGAKFVPYIKNGELVDIIIEEPGEGYTFINIDIIGAQGIGSGASAEAIFSQGVADTFQSTVEQTAVRGAIHAVKVINPGFGYTQGAFSISGDGAGLKIEPVFVGGALSRVNVIETGEGYTFADITFAGDGFDMSVAAIISPEGGHGKDAVKELYSSTLCLFSSVTQEKFNNKNIVVDNDFRQFGIIRDPKKYVSESPLSLLFATAMHSIVVADPSNIFKDQKIYINNRVYTVVEKIVSTILVLGINNNDIISVGDMITFDNNPNFTNVTNVDDGPQVNRFSGEMIYVSNNPGINFSEEQLITLKTYITL